MNPRILVLIAMLTGLFLLMVTLIRWGESYRLHNREQQQVASREESRPPSPTSRTRTQHPIFPLPTPTPLRFPTQTAFARVPQRSWIGYPAPSKIVSYLSEVSAIEQDSRQVRQAWILRVTPTEITDSASPNPVPTPSPSQLMRIAEQWDKKLVGKLPDSTCLPFHLAYLHYLALEQSYLRRLTLLEQEGTLSERQILQTEMEQALVQAALSVQSKLRDLQHDHPELTPALTQLQIR